MLKTEIVITGYVSSCVTYGTVANKHKAPSKHHQATTSSNKRQRRRQAAILRLNSSPPSPSPHPPSGSTSRRHLIRELRQRQVVRGSDHAPQAGGQHAPRPRHGRGEGRRPVGSDGPGKPVAPDQIVQLRSTSPPPPKKKHKAKRAAGSTYVCNQPRRKATYTHVR